jgi:hypothetical protein
MAFVKSCDLVAVATPLDYYTALLVALTVSVIHLFLMGGLLFLNAGKESTSSTVESDPRNSSDWFL